MRTYNYNTGKVYESVGTFILTVTETPLSDDVTIYEPFTFNETYVSKEEAIDNAYTKMKELASEENVDEDSVEYVEDDDVVTFTAPGYKKWVFTVSGNYNNDYYESVANRKGNGLNEERDGFELPRQLRTHDIHALSDAAKSNIEKRRFYQEFALDVIVNMIRKNYINVDIEPAARIRLTDRIMNDDYLMNPSLGNMTGYVNAIKNIIIWYLKNYTNYEIGPVFLTRIDIDIENYIRQHKDSFSMPNESVANRFAKYRALFESDDEDNKDDENNDSDENDGENNDDSDDKKDDEDDDYEEMKPIIITVHKGDEEDCKQEMIDAGVAEDDIEIITDEDDEETGKLRVMPNSAPELKEYLDGKNFDLEEIIGGEIEVECDDESDDEEGDDKNGDEEGGDDNPDFNIDDLGDIFGADDEGK